MNVSNFGKRALIGQIIRGRNANREKGMTTLGLIIVIGVVGLFAFAGIRLTPVYLNYIKVNGVLEGVYDEFDSQGPSRESVRRSIVRRFEVESVDVITHRDIKVTPQDGGFMIEAKYDHTTPFIANLHFTVRFDKSILIRR